MTDGRYYALAEIAVGYRLERHADDSSRAYGVRVNPEDKIIVLAED